MKLNIIECLNILMDKEVDILTRLLSLRKVQLAVHLRKKFRKTKKGELCTNVRTRLWESVNHHTIVSLIRCIQTDSFLLASIWHGMPVSLIYNLLGESIRSIRPDATIMGASNIDKILAKNQESKGFLAYLRALDILIRAEEPIYKGRSRFSLNTICNLVEAETIKVGANVRSIRGLSSECGMASAFYVQTYHEESKLFKWRSCTSLDGILIQIDMLEKPDYVMSEMLSLNAKIVRLSDRYKPMPEFLGQGMVEKYTFQQLSSSEQQAINECHVGSADL